MMNYYIITERVLLSDFLMIEFTLHDPLLPGFAEWLEIEMHPQFICCQVSSFFSFLSV